MKMYCKLVSWWRQLGIRNKIHKNNTVIKEQFSEARRNLYTLKKFHMEDI